MEQAPSFIVLEETLCKPEHQNHRDRSTNRHFTTLPSVTRGTSCEACVTNRITDLIARTSYRCDDLFWPVLPGQPIRRV